MSRKARSRAAQQKRVNGHRGVIGVYKTYMFRNKDPVIDELRTILQDNGASYKDVHDAGGPTEGTLFNWFKGDTRRPTNAAVEATGRAIGHKRVWVKEKR